MIRLSPFTLVAPTSLAEVAKMLIQGDEQTKILAGGTDLVVKLKQGLYSPRRLVWIGKLKELYKIAFSPTEGLRVGALCTLSEIASSQEVLRHYPAFACAAQSVASPAIRNKASIGGNLCVEPRCFYYDQSEFWRGALGGCLKLKVDTRSDEGICRAAPGLSRCSAVFCSDTAPMLIALRASVKVLSANGERTMVLSDLYGDDGINFLTLKSGEFIREICVPVPSRGQRSVFKKLRLRDSIDFAIVNVAASLVVEGTKCLDARIVVGAISSAPVRMQQAEAILVGSELTEEKIRQAAEVTSSSIKPLPNVVASVAYRKKMAGVLVEEAIGELARV